jgi:large subunit ribosomal protein L4e
VVDAVPEIPLVVSSEVEKLSKTKAVLAFLEKVGVLKDVERVIRSKKIRAGKGKMRGRRYRQAVGPLIVVSRDDGIVKAARNIPGVEICTVDGLNITRLAPGGVPGRLTVWSERAIEEVGRRFGQ